MAHFQRDRFKLFFSFVLFFLSSVLLYCLNRFQFHGTDLKFRLQSKPYKVGEWQPELKKKRHRNVNWWKMLFLFGWKIQSNKAVMPFNFRNWPQIEWSKFVKWPKKQEFNQKKNTCLNPTLLKNELPEREGGRERESGRERVWERERVRERERV